MSKPSTSAAMIMHTSPGSTSSEAYRALRFNVECLGLDREIKTVAITSAGRSEGKTTTALNLAVAYAQIGKRVLLLDADLRNPSIHLTFGGDNTRGLTNYLIKPCTLSDIISDSQIENLSVMKSGPAAPNPTELLASGSMNTLLSELKQDYDLVIIDTSSVLTITDAKIIAAKCDGVLLVIRYGKLKRHVAKKVKEELTLAKAKLMGVVMNKINRQDTEAYF
jgi:capsular exopolysaccharide synthesis family protein